MIRSLLFATIFLPACVASPFTVGTSAAVEDDAGDAGAVAVVPPPTVPAPAASTLPQALTLDAGSPPEAGPPDAEAPEASPEASTLETSTPEASPDVLPRPIDVVCHLSIGNVGCPGAGVWTVYYGGESCDANRAPTASCPVGAPCQATNTPGGTVYQGTCE